MAIIAALAGLLVWILLAAMAWKCSTEWPALCRYDRIGSLVFFVVVDLPLSIAGLAMIVQAIKT
jgi:hypothetical protein